MVAYLSNLPIFDVLALTEIGSRNIEMTQNLLEGYSFIMLNQIKIIMEELEFNGGTIFKISLKLI